MLGLRQQVCRDPIGMPAGVGEDQHFGRSRDHIDANPAEDNAFGGGDICVAGTDDLGDRRDGCGAVGERRYRLRAADAIDFVDAGQLRRGEH